MSVCLSLLVANACALMAFAAPNPTDCSDAHYEHPIRSLKASAAVWANLRNKPGSVRYESNQIFVTAQSESGTVRAPKNFCPAGCPHKAPGEFIFRTKPAVVLTDSPDKAYCAGLERLSTAMPYQYSSDTIHTVTQLNDWIGELSQGDGENGKDLYQKCDRSCSPRYEYVIRKNPRIAGTYTATASVICGQPRDKGKNEYDLQAFFRWRCAR